MSNKMYDNITGRSPIATDDLGYIGTGQKASQILSNGTTDYDDLTNKPSINNVELSGNKTSSDLGLQSALTETQTAAVNSGITAEDVEQITTNKNNISLCKQFTDNATIDSNRKLYISATKPTGDIPQGSTWIDGKTIKTYGRTNNYFNKDATSSAGGYVVNSYLNNDGTTTTNQAYRVSEYIAVTENTTFTYNNQSNSQAPAICFYDDNKDYISGTNWGGSNNTTFTTPVNTAYIRISYIVYNADTTMLNEGDTLMSYEPYYAWA